MSELTDIEKDVLRTILAGEGETERLLRNQIACAVASSRNLTGTGFYTRICIPSAVARLTNTSAFQVGPIEGSAANLNHGIGFVLFIKDGGLHALEGFTYDEPWPVEIQSLTLHAVHLKQDY